MAFPAGWSKRVEVEILPGQVTGTVSNFVAYINEDLILANNPNALTVDHADAIKADGGDLRASSDAAGAEQIPLEVSVINEGDGELGIYALLPSAAVGTKFYLWWGKADATLPAPGSTFGSQAVWPDAAAVYHCEEAPDYGVNSFYDSKNDAVNAKYVGTAAQMESDPTTMQAGIAPLEAYPLGNALSRTGADLAFANGSTLSFSTILKWQGISGHAPAIMSNCDLSVFGINYSFGITAADKLVFSFFTSAGAAYASWESTDALTRDTDNFKHFGFSFTFGDHTSIVVTYDGVALAGSWVHGTGDEAPDNDAAWSFLLGCAFFSADYRVGIEGILDECRMIRGARTEAYFEAESNNNTVPVDFMTISAAESPALIPVPARSYNIGLNSNQRYGLGA